MNAKRVIIVVALTIVTVAISYGVFWYRYGAGDSTGAPAPDNPQHEWPTGGSTATAARDDVEITAAAPPPPKTPSRRQE